jgi:excisionase family DNA binding protein
MQKLLSKRQAAAILSVSVRTLDRLRSTKEIRAVKVRGAVRFEPEEIERYIERQAGASR